MRLTLVISSLVLGGAEGVFARLANGLARRGHSIALLTLDDGALPPFYALAPGVRHQALGLARASAGLLDALRANLGRIRTLRRAMLASHGEERPGAVLTFMDTTNILALLALAGTGVPAIVCERTDPRLYDIGPLWRGLRRLAYPLAARVVAQTEAVCRTLPGRCVALPNPVEPPPDLGAGWTPPQGSLLLALGRLAPEKGFDLLLQAFASIATAHPDWTLVILGEGPERPALEALRASLGLEGRVLLPGRVDAPGGTLRRADLFVLSSRFEGFPNALCEAMACGLPAVAFDCPSGPGEIVRHGVDGLLAPPGDVGALAEALSALMGDDIRRRAMAARAPEVLERFGLEKVLDMWEELLMHVAKQRSGA